MFKGTVRSLMPEAIYDTFRRAKHKRAADTFPDYVSQKRVAGYPLKIVIADPVAAEWYGDGPHHAPEIEFLKQFDLTGRTIFDLGSHQSVTSMVLAHMTGDAGDVISVEPNGHNHDIAKKNLAINGLRNVIPLRAIVSSGTFNVSIDGGLVGRTRFVSGSKPEIDIITIDDLSAAFGDPSLVFMDIEGHEIEALIGALKTLAVQHCHWLVELHGDESLATYGHKNSDIFRFFPDGMFRALVLDVETGDFIPLTRRSLPHTRCHVFFERLRASERDIHNF
ncbi:FkbM family methyltransferase [Rhizobium sp. L1K21]|uniref:FkbM family methyltransferase n=1 Tax=Rhizobium sp. L1K21 TaxID=2954933 RepID=UPI0020927EAC|nr:FkbM family methyltransferase [Rhizobium sp. L1K21]MCO6186489.1 FkbM family methyltransferase [Rhizobium sp. L1K21]